MPYSEGDKTFAGRGVGYRWHNLLPKIYSARESISTLGLCEIIRTWHEYADCVLAGGRCDLVVDVSREEDEDHGNWQDLWYAANTVYWMCVRQGKAGRATGLGMVQTSSPNKGIVLIEGNDRYPWKFECGFFGR